MDVRLASDQTAEQIREAGESPVVQLPYTSPSWMLMQYLSCGDAVLLCPADGGIIAGRVEDIDEDRYTVTVELN